MMKQKIRRVGIFLLLVIILSGCSKLEENTEFTAEGIRKLSVSKNGEVIYSIAYEPEEYENSYEYWKMPVPYESKAIINTEEMLKFYEVLANLEFSNAVETKEDTGLSKPYGEILLEFGQPTKESTYESKADSTCTLLIGNEDGEGNYYTALKSNVEKVYLMKTETIDAVLNANPFSLILKVGTVVDVNTVSKVNILMDGKAYQMSAGNHELYAQLLSVFIEKEMPKEQEGHKEEILLHLEFIRNKEGADDVIVEYYVYDGDYAVLKLDGVEKFLVKIEDVEHLKIIISDNLD